MHQVKFLGLFSQNVARTYIKYFICPPSAYITLHVITACGKTSRRLLPSTFALAPESGLILEAVKAGE